MGELDKLQANLIPTGQSQRSCVLHGMAGVGKTQTALEFCYSSLQQNIFQYTFWIPAEDESQLALEFGKIAHRVQPSLFHHLTDFATDIASAHEWLSQSKQQTIGMLAILLIMRSSRTDNCSCVDQNWLLEQGLGDASDSLCKSISREVNGLPLRLTPYCWLYLI